MYSFFVSSSHEKDVVVHKIKKNMGVIKGFALLRKIIDKKIKILKQDDDNKTLEAKDFITNAYNDVQLYKNIKQKFINNTTLLIDATVLLHACKNSIQPLLSFYGCKTKLSTPSYFEHFKKKLPNRASLEKYFLRTIDASKKNPDYYKNDDVVKESKAFLHGFFMYCLEKFIHKLKSAFCIDPKEKNYLQNAKYIIFFFDNGQVALKEREKDKRKKGDEMDETTINNILQNDYITDENFIICLKNLMEKQLQTWMLVNFITQEENMKTIIRELGIKNIYVSKSYRNEADVEMSRFCQLLKHISKGEKENEMTKRDCELYSLNNEISSQNLSWELVLKNIYDSNANNIILYGIDIDMVFFPLIANIYDCDFQSLKLDKTSNLSNLQFTVIQTRNHLRKQQQASNYLQPNYGLEDIVCSFYNLSLIEKYIMSGMTSLVFSLLSGWDYSDSLCSSRDFTKPNYEKLIEQLLKLELNSCLCPTLILARELNLIAHDKEYCPYCLKKFIPHLGLKAHDYIKSMHGNIKKQYESWLENMNNIITNNSITPEVMRLNSAAVITALLATYDIERSTFEDQICWDHYINKKIFKKLCSFQNKKNSFVFAGAKESNDDDDDDECDNNNCKKEDIANKTNKLIDNFLALNNFIITNDDDKKTSCEQNVIRKSLTDFKNIFIKNPQQLWFQLLVQIIDYFNGDYEAYCKQLCEFPAAHVFNIGTRILFNHFLRNFG